MSTTQTEERLAEKNAFVEVTAEYQKNYVADESVIKQCRIFKIKNTYKRVLGDFREQQALEKRSLKIKQKEEMKLFLKDKNNTQDEIDAKFAQNKVAQAELNAELAAKSKIFSAQKKVEVKAEIARV